MLMKIIPSGPAVSYRSRRRLDPFKDKFLEKLSKIVGTYSLGNTYCMYLTKNSIKIHKIIKKKKHKADNTCFSLK